MPSLAPSFSAWQAATLVLAGALIAVAAAIAYGIWKRARVSPEERERRRRAFLVEVGKITDATLVEIRDDALFYSYLVRGVEYTASQDIAALKAYMPAELGLGVRPISVRYHPKNPADSIVIAEGWSGLRVGK